MCKSEKHTNILYNKYTEGNICNVKRCLKLYYDNKNKISNERKTFYE